MKNEELAYLVYKHTSPSGKAYIGLTRNYSARCTQHQHSKSGCVAFYNAIKKHGWDNFKHEILITDLSLDDANTWENLLIDEHKTMSPNGYNLKTGGDKGVHCLETRLKMSESGKKRAPISKETSIRMSIASATRSIETREKLSHSARNRAPASPETCSRISASKLGHTVSDETKEKLSKANIGKKLPAETCAKMAASRKKPWNIITPTGEKITIMDMKQFCLDNGFSYASMNASLHAGGSHKGYRKQA
jgi:group I intron endonuclease